MNEKRRCSDRVLPSVGDYGRFFLTVSDTLDLCRINGIQINRFYSN